MDNAFYRVWYLSVLTGRSIVGIRAEDVNRLTKLLLRRPDISERYGFVKETTAFTFLYATAYNLNMKKMFLNRSLSSYSSLVKSQFYDARFIYDAVANSLEYYDLPDLATAALAPRRWIYFNLVYEENKMMAHQVIPFLSNSSSKR